MKSDLARLPLPFDEIWTLDMEFRAPPGERPTPHCLVAHELRSARVVRRWLPDGSDPGAPPFETGARSLFIAYYSSAEWGCFLSLGWPLPIHVIDLFAEFRQQTNGLNPAHGNGLIGALLFHGLRNIDAAEKSEMRELAIRGGPFTVSEQEALLDYCKSDVRALDLLLPALVPHLDLPQALLRGRYMKSAAHMEYNGIPINTPLYASLRENWRSVVDAFTREAHALYGVFPAGRFSQECLIAWAEQNGVSWPRTSGGRLSLSDETLKKMSRAHPILEPLRRTLEARGKLRNPDLSIGSDGRNRTLLSAFRAKTSRNQPSSSRYAFGVASWMRRLIAPAPGRALAYLDYEQQEFAIAAVLSGDTAMRNAYESGDPYLAFAKQAGAAPGDATRVSHAATRKRFKQCALAVQYGMGPQALSDTLGQSVAHARELLELHKRTYPRYWEWVEETLDRALICGRLRTALGWEIRVGSGANPRSLVNFPVQASGAEVLRLACIFAVEAGVTVCGPVHDALLIEATIDALPDAIALTRRAMIDAGRIALTGFELRIEVAQFAYPAHLKGPNDEQTWKTIQGVLDRT